MVVQGRNGLRVMCSEPGGSRRLVRGCSGLALELVVGGRVGEHAGFPSGHRAVHAAPNPNAPQ